MRNSAFVSPRQFAHHLPGEIVTALVRNPLQSPKTKGKARPVILLQRDRAHWLVMGLTTLDHFADGTPRRSVPNPSACGLGAGVSYLWGLASWVSVLDIGDHIGDADKDLLCVLTALGVEAADLTRAH
ncbi:MAG: hypothetical protein WBK19_15890 [Azonexus sp.]